MAWEVLPRHAQSFGQAQKGAACAPPRAPHVSQRVPSTYAHVAVTTLCLAPLLPYHLWPSAGTSLILVTPLAWQRQWLDRHEVWRKERGIFYFLNLAI